MKGWFHFLFRWLEDHARRGNYDVTIENVTDNMSCLGVAGPHSRDVLSKLTSTDMSNSQFKFLAIKDIELAGAPVRAMRISYTGNNNNDNLLAYIAHATCRNDRMRFT